jgi:hypothetical protein
MRKMMSTTLAGTVALGLALGGSSQATEAAGAAAKPEDVTQAINDDEATGN